MSQIQAEHVKRFGQYISQNKWWERRFLDFKEDDIKALLEAAVHITGTWPVDLRLIINWLNETELPQEFQIDMVKRITDGKAYKASLLENLKSGPSGPRATYGALQRDLRTLYAMFGPKDADEVPF